ncbi:MAG: hypothetical protein GY705_07600, partial [Bacteroidetes bacterium]|nr:hypothetical protein [Bacteroidota bacterium]
MGNSFVKRLANDGFQGLIPWNCSFDVTEQAVTFVHTLWEHKIFKICDMEKKSFERDLKEFVGFVDMIVLIIGGNDIADDAYGTVGQVNGILNIMKKWRGYISKQICVVELPFRFTEGFKDYNSQFRPET